MNVALLFGYLETSAGRQDFYRHGRMTWEYDRAGPDAVSLMGELPKQATLALGFGTSKESAATLAMSSLTEDFSEVWGAQCRVWEAWHKNCHLLDLPHNLQRRLALSGMVLKVHGDRTYCGATVASLAIPWGEDSQSRGGYHLVWCRDLVETAGAMVVSQSSVRCLLPPQWHATTTKTKFPVQSVFCHCHLQLP